MNRRDFRKLRALPSYMRAFIDSWRHSNASVERKKFWCYDDEKKKYYVVDNTSGSCRIDEFNDEEHCLLWLDGQRTE